ncbi:MAG: MarR family transcriptional regulator [Clostridia bacterium]|nr:MarR family transcriptional regulator [Clostridia bacterium]
MSEKIRKVREAFHGYHCNHRSVVESGFREKGLYFGQPPILKYLSEHKNATQKEIANSLHVSPPSVANSVKRMEESGLIVRVADRKDARCNNLQLTQKGKNLSEYADKLFEVADETSFNGFSDEEIDLILSFLERMTENIKSLGKENNNV